jgi:hypothetical protein
MKSAKSTHFPYKSPIYSYRGIVDFLGIMTEVTVESIFGMKAGVVWEALNKNGPSNIGDIVKATGLRRELVYGALGWLGREGKISVERRGKAIIFSLRQSYDF